MNQIKTPNCLDDKYGIVYLIIGITFFGLATMFINPVAVGLTTAIGGLCCLWAGGHFCKSYLLQSPYGRELLNKFDRI